MADPTVPPERDFIRAMIARDQAAGKHGGRVMTRFPPEPNGYLHIGHAKSICLNFGVADEFRGRCNLRFDDTNPTTEDERFVDSIQNDIRWLGFEWGERLYFASDYFEQLYDLAVGLIEAGKAYVDSSTLDEIREARGTVTEPGRPSPYRDRPVEESLDLFRRMRAGEFADGAHVLRARIDMAAPNMLMRDPLLYRIRHAHHYRRGDEWCIYPMYDFAHGLSDSIEGVTHSLCTLEFKDNRELYDWLIRETAVENKPEQTEFARLNLDYTVLSKRRLIRLVREGHVTGWDDPRMPTLAGLRRRGVTPDAIRAFCDLIGVARVDSRVDIGKLEYAIRDDLNFRAPRVMCVLRPLKAVITNYPEKQKERLNVPSFPHDVPKEGSRSVPFEREIFIERDDFMEEPVPGFHRLAPGREVRLRYAYLITCDEVVREPTTGEVVQLRCSYDPETRGGRTPDGRKVKSTIHWVSAAESVPCEVRLYDRLFSIPVPEADGDDFTDNLNPASLVTLPGARIEPSVRRDPPGTRYQFERQGYFVQDSVDSRKKALVFNRTVTLRDSWEKARTGGASSSRPERKPKRVPERAGAGTVSTRPELTPAERDRARDLERRGVTATDAETLARDEAMAEFFGRAADGPAAPGSVATWIVNELAGVLGGRPAAETALEPAAFAALVDLVDRRVVSRPVGKEILAELVASGGDPAAMVRERGLERVADPDVIAGLVADVVTEFPDKVEAYRAGRSGLLGFFVGQVMRRTNGTADPELVQTAVRDALI